MPLMLKLRYGFRGLTTAPRDSPPAKILATKPRITATQNLRNMTKPPLNVPGKQARQSPLLQRRRENYSVRKLEKVPQHRQTRPVFGNNRENRKFAAWLPIIRSKLTKGSGEPAKLPNFWLIDSSFWTQNPVN
jgi:hypothetical protein